MSEILTAEEYLKSNIDITKDGGENVNDSARNVKEVMIMFAKLHVEAALKAAEENAKMDCDPYQPEDIWIDKDSILNAYSLENIK